MVFYVASVGCFFQKINSYQALKDEIALLRITVPLSMFCLDCTHVNEDLAARAQRLKERLVQYEVYENRELNRRLVLVDVLPIYGINNPVQSCTSICTHTHKCTNRHTRLNVKNNVKVFFELTNIN